MGKGNKEKGSGRRRSEGEEGQRKEGGNGEMGKKERGRGGKGKERKEKGRVYRRKVFASVKIKSWVRPWCFYFLIFAVLVALKTWEFSIPALSVDANDSQYSKMHILALILREMCQFLRAITRKRTKRFNTFRFITVRSSLRVNHRRIDTLC